MWNIESAIGGIWAAWLGNSDSIGWAVVAYVIFHLALGNILAWSVYPARYAECYELRAIYGFRVTAGIIACIVFFISVVYIYSNPFYLRNPIAFFALAFWVLAFCGSDLLLVMILGNKMRDAIAREGYFSQDEVQAG